MSKNSKSGFTLIELIMIIVILGILSAVAIPKYVDLKTEARTATANGILGAAASACAVNYAAVQTKTPAPSPITTCTLLNSAITSSGVTISGGNTVECSFTVDSKSFTFTLTVESDSSPCIVTKTGAWAG